MVQIPPNFNGLVLHNLKLICAHVLSEDLFITLGSSSLLSDED